MEEIYMTLPILDPNFKPAIIELRKFNEDVAKSENKQHLIIAIERNNGYVYRKELDIFADGIDDERNVFIVERLIKSILWVVGGLLITLNAFVGNEWLLLIIIMVMILNQTMKKLKCGTTKQKKTVKQLMKAF